MVFGVWIAVLVVCGFSVAATVTFFTNQAVDALSKAGTLQHESQSDSKADFSPLQLDFKNNSANSGPNELEGWQEDLKALRRAARGARRNSWEESKRKVRQKIEENFNYDVPINRIKIV